MNNASILCGYLSTFESIVEKHDLKTKTGRLAHVIETSGQTPASMARLLGCEPAAVYQWLNGSTKNLKEEYLWKLADISGFEARWISLGEGAPKKDIAIRHAETVLTAMEPEARYIAIRLIDTLAESPKKDNPIELP